MIPLFCKVPDDPVSSGLELRICSFVSCLLSAKHYNLKWWFSSIIWLYCCMYLREVLRFDSSARVVSLFPWKFAIPTSGSYWAASFENFVKVYALKAKSFELAANGLAAFYANLLLIYFLRVLRLRFSLRALTLIDPWPLLWMSIDTWEDRIGVTSFGFVL